MLTIHRVKSARVRKDDEGNVKPPLVCDRYSEHVIEPGMPYKWVKVDRFSARRVRCDRCPDWKVWEVKHTLDAQLQRISYEFYEAIKDAESTDAVQDALNEAAEEVRGLAEERRESASNCPEGSGVQQQLEEQADELESWADEIENADIPELPDPAEEDCQFCDGTGEQEAPESTEEDEKEAVECPECEDGKVTPEEPDEDQLEEWRQEVATEMGVIDDRPF